MKKLIALLKGALWGVLSFAAISTPLNGLSQTNSVPFTVSLTSYTTNGTKNTYHVPVKSAPPTISITNPKNNAVFNTAWVNICGTFTGTAVRQISFNERPAYINGNTFEMIVPLEVGTNTITMVVQDWDLSDILLSNEDTADANKAAMLAQSFDGRTAEASINIIRITKANEEFVAPVQAQVTPVGGFAPLQVTFSVQAHIPGKIQNVFYDFNGDGVADQTNSNLQPITHKYTTYGEYFPIVTVQTDVGRFSSLSSPSGMSVISVMLLSAFGGPTPLYVNVQMPPVLLSTIKVADPVDVKWTATSNLYVLSGSTATITEFDANGKIIRSKTGIGLSPSGLAVDATGNVYVAVTGNNQVWKFKPTANSFEADASFGTSGFIGNKDGSAGVSSNQFNAPFDVAVSSDGQTITVSDSGNQRIQHLTMNGTLTHFFGGESQFKAPKGLAQEAGIYLFIVESGNIQLVQADDFMPMGSSGTNGSALGQFNEAMHLAANKRALYVADSGNNRVQVFSHVEGGEMHSPVPFNPRVALSGELGLNHPKAVAAVEDPAAEKLYIADTGNNRVILVKLPLDNPEAVWANMKAHLTTGDVPGAVFYFSDEMKALYRSAFLTMDKSEKLSWADSFGTIKPVSIANGEAEYSCKNRDGTPDTVKFQKENGVWKIKMNAD